MSGFSTAAVCLAMVAKAGEGTIDSVKDDEPIPQEKFQAFMEKLMGYVADVLEGREPQ
jgi:CxxC motif-containing protein